MTKSKTASEMVNTALNKDWTIDPTNLKTFSNFELANVAALCDLHSATINNLRILEEQIKLYHYYNVPSLPLAGIDLESLNRGRHLLYLARLWLEIKEEQKRREPTKE